jgi:glucose 1-dehydrogenase
MSFAGKVAVVTGASHGIGRAIAVALAKAGADVAINYTGDQSDAEEVAQQIATLGRRALLCPGDVSDWSKVEQIVERVARELGRLDVAVANAAFSERETFHRADMAKFRRTIDVTMWGAFHLLRAAAVKLIDQRQGGSMVAISSPHAYLPVRDAMAYNMAKAAVDQMARTAAVELAEHRIRVNLVHPGWTDTPGERKHYDEQTIADRAAKLAWGRMAKPEEIARAVLFLCNPASDYITGSSLVVDAGQSLAHES